MKILSNSLLSITSRRTADRRRRAWPYGYLRRTRSNATQLSGALNVGMEHGWPLGPSERRKEIVHFVKMGILLLIWFVCTCIVFTFAAAVEPQSTMVTVEPNKTALRKVELPNEAVRITLQGPVNVYSTNYPEEHHGGYGAGLRVEWRSSDLNVTYSRTAMWNIAMESDPDVYEAVAKDFRIPREGGAGAQAVVSLESRSDSPVSFHMTMDTGALLTDMAVLCGALLLLVLYLLIIFDIIDHTFAALIIATTAIATLATLNHRPSVEKIVSFINFEPLMLLFGLMTIVDIMATTGVFDYLIVWTYRISRGRPWWLIFFLSMMTAFLSALLNSDIMALALTPMTIRLCEEMSLRTTYVLVVVALFADMGGALTPMGNPPNAIVTTNPTVVAQGVDFVNFVVHMAPGVLVSMFVVFAIVYVTHRKTIFVLDQNQTELVEKKNKEKEPPSQETKDRIEQLKKKEYGKHWLKPVDNFPETLANLEAESRIRDKPLLIKCCIALGFALICMMLHSIPQAADGASLGWVAILATILLIILRDNHDFDASLAIIQWTILLFIAAIFVFTEVLYELGLFEWLGDRAVMLLTRLKIEHQLAVTMMAILWSTALLCIFIDNAAVTIFMLRLCFQMDVKDHIPLPPMFWALTFGACFGGNGSLFGAVSNEIIALIALQHGYKITFWHFFVIGFPMMLATLVIGSAYLLIAHVACSWH
ncbi:P protein [Drosophila ficusphila]|uniref:P protein n=1 Tax=Drosophila ficusphila TaxID=30025 RepID=UPI0007E6E05B|nr:P protein [Drosophila ficusphila]